MSKKLFLIFTADVCLAIVFTFTALSTHAAENIIINGSREKQVVALTFDADMSPKMLHDLKSGKVKSWYDKRITETLEKEKVPATIFATGLWVQAYPEALKQLAQNTLFEIGNHSYDHAAFHLPCYGLWQAPDKQKEVQETQKIIKKITGKEPALFRFPGGCFATDDLKIVEQNNLKPIQWDVVSGDAFSSNAKEIYQRVLNKTKNGSIIVMHLSGGSNAPSTWAALPVIIKGLRARGLEFVTVSELLR